MPRKQRQQPGSSGGAYKNRTDLTQPVALPTNLPYGERQQLQQAQQGAPLPQVAPTPQAPQDPAVAAAAAHNGPAPTQSLAAPTQRPMEPIQHGLPTGPGGGPEVLGSTDNTAAVLARLAMSTGSSAIQDLANRARQFGV